MAKKKHDSILKPLKKVLPKGHPNPPKKTHSEAIKDVTVFQAGGTPHPALSNPSNTMGSTSVYNTSQVQAAPNINGVPKSTQSKGHKLPKQTVVDGNVAGKPTIHQITSPGSHVTPATASKAHGSVKTGKQKTSGSETATSTNALEQWWSGLEEQEKTMVKVGSMAIVVILVPIIIYSAKS